MSEIMFCNLYVGILVYIFEISNDAKLVCGFTFISFMSLDGVYS